MRSFFRKAKSLKPTLFFRFSPNGLKTLTTPLILTTALGTTTFLSKSPAYFFINPSENYERIPEQNHPDYERRLQAVKSSLNGRKELTYKDLINITNLVILIGADTYVSTMHRLRETRTQKQENPNKYDALLSGGIAELNLVKKFLNAILEDLGLHYSDWIRAQHKLNKDNFKEVNPLYQLDHLYKLSQKTKNITKESLIEIYEAQLAVYEEFTQDEEIQEVVNDYIELLGKDKTDISVFIPYFFNCAVEESIQESIGTLPGDGLYSGFSHLSEFIEYERRLGEARLKLLKKVLGDYYVDLYYFDINAEKER